MKTDILQEINRKETLHLNRLPAITWRWLKVNDFPLKGLKIDKIQPFIENDIQSSAQEGVEIKYISENVYNYEVEKYFMSLKSPGISEEITQLAHQQYNTGSFIKILENQRIASSLWLSYKSSKESPTIIDKHLIIAEENSECTIIMDYSSEDLSPAFHNGLTRIYAKDGSKIKLVKIQTLNDKSLNMDAHIAFVGYGAQVDYVSIELGAEKSFTSYTSNLERETATSHLDSLYLTDKKRVLDMNYIMNHIGRRTLSDIQVRGALKDESKKTFKGTLDFKRGARLSRGGEEEYAILLDPKVHNNAIPLLLCEEDDVQGQHAASAGRIDENKLFYLMSRGFSQKEAKKIIIESSFRPIIDKVPVEELKKKIQDNIESRLMKDEGGKSL
ncbi:Fe-S cluster assembly protein SufD [Irregularibacter muris]|uniref:Fe-S cluster assembly protein SufD n=1 Tax=Irregularibacter muris TaxID=1796619 RepID=A0AAE3KZX6_9FIRM|nr:Fe-S cluster assembly protein SufD [Irregularibacter muris]MCR1899341.1 Fe-S cluster assembly protein SufD [Irregularibacter muris]